MTSVNEFANELLTSFEASAQGGAMYPEELVYTVEIIDTIKSCINQLNSKVVSEGFSTQEQEIEYFKLTFPKFYSRLIYHVRLGAITSMIPPGSVETSSIFVKETKRIHAFLNKYQEAYRYYRLGLSYLDDKYFVREVKDLNYFQTEHLLIDTRLNTYMSLQFAKFRAYEMILSQIAKEDKTTNPDLNDNIKTLQWNAQKVQLAELIYALDALKVFGNENTMFIAQTICKQWNIKLSFIHKTFEEIRLRKKNGTPFLDLLKSTLIKRMEDDYEK